MNNAPAKLVAIGDQNFTQFFSLLGVDVILVPEMESMPEQVLSASQDHGIAALVLQAEYCDPAASWYDQLVVSQKPFTTLPGWIQGQVTEKI